MPAGRGFIDDIIEPKQTRPKLISALQMLKNKRDIEPAEEARQYPAVGGYGLGLGLGLGRPTADGATLCVISSSVVCRLCRHRSPS